MMNTKRLTPLLAALMVAAVPALSMAQPADRDWHDHHDWDHPGYRHDDYRGVGPNHGWHRGDRLPNAYWGHRYEVADWRAHHLAEPPRGYHWVQVNGDYVLAAVATGVILDTLLTQ
jgi:Ni/Co efflux regulator RcnB